LFPSNNRIEIEKHTAGMIRNQSKFLHLSNSVYFTLFLLQINKQSSLLLHFHWTNPFQTDRMNSDVTNVKAEL